MCIAAFRCIIDIEPLIARSVATANLFTKCIFLENSDHIFFLKMDKIVLIDIDSSSDDENTQTASRFKPESIDGTLNSFKDEVRQESTASVQPGPSNENDNQVGERTSSVDAPPALEQVGEGNEQDDEAKRHKYIDKLLNMHAHVCNRLSTLDCYMDPLQRLKWQRQTTMSVPAINGKFPTNPIQNEPSHPVNNSSRQRSAWDRDSDWGDDSRPPWLINNGPNSRYRNGAAPRARRKTYRRKRTTKKPTKQTARKSTATRAPVLRKSQPATKAKQTAKATAPIPSTSKASASSNAKKSKLVPNPKPNNTPSPVKKEIVKRETVKREHVKGEPH